MKEPLISIIVPVYNTQHLLHMCLNSLKYQTYKNLEIILVNDGSIDASEKVCLKFASRDKRIKYCKQRHSGPGSARNLGLELSHGDYIGFVDSDNFISLNFYEYLYKILTENNADIAQCSYTQVSQLDGIYSRFHLDYQPAEELEFLDSSSAIKRLFDDDQSTCVKSVVLWNKLYKKSLFDDIRFPYVFRYEDELTTYKLLEKSKKIVSSNQILYGYVQRGLHLRSRIFDKTRLDALKAYDNYMLYFKEKKSPEMLEKAGRRYLRMLYILRDKITPYKIVVERKYHVLQEIDIKFSSILKYLNILVKKHPELSDKKHLHEEYCKKYKQMVKQHTKINNIKIMHKEFFQ